MNNFPISKPLSECTNEEVLQRWTNPCEQNSAPRWVVIVMAEALGKRGLVNEAKAIAESMKGTI